MFPARSSRVPETGSVTGALDLQNLTRDKFVWLRQVSSDPAVGHLSARLATLLVDYIHPRHGVGWPSQSAMAEAAGVTVRGVQKALKGLEDAGHLQIIVQRGRTNTNRYRPLLRNTNERPGKASENPNTGDGKPEPPFGRLPESNLSPLPPADRAPGRHPAAVIAINEAERAAIGLQFRELARQLGDMAPRVGGRRHA